MILRWGLFLATDSLNGLFDLGVRVHQLFLILLLVFLLVVDITYIFHVPEKFLIRPIKG